MGQRNQDILDALRQSHLFTRLTDVQLERVYRHSQVTELDEGQLLFSQVEALQQLSLV